MADWFYSTSLILGDGNRVLLIEGEQGWCFPVLDIDGHHDHIYTSQHKINAYFQADTSIVRAVHFDVDREQYHTHIWWLIENHMPGWTPPTASRWLPLADLSSTTLALAEKDRAILDIMLANDNTPHRPVFMQMGWYGKVRAWMLDVIAQQGLTLIQPPEQFKHFIYTAIIRAETSDGYVYAKLPNMQFPYFCEEATTTQALSELYTSHVPKPIAIHAETGMGLYRDFGSTLREKELEEVHAREIVKTFAQIQIDSTKRLDALKKAGCIDRRLAMLKSMVDEMIANEAPFHALTDEEMERWRNSGSILKDLFDRLEGYQLPDALVHGDFHRGNMTLHNNQITFFDWTDACISHPFMDIATIVEFNPDHADILRDAYLECWLDFAPMENLREAYDIAFILGAYNQLVSYRSFQDNCEPAYQPVLEWSIPRFTRVILEKLDAM